MRWIILVILLAPEAAFAQDSGSDAGSTPQAQAPMGNMAFAPGRWTLTPALGVIQINTTTSADATADTAVETSSLFLPALGLGAVYTFNERWAVYAAAYGTRLKGDVEGNLLAGKLILGLGMSTLGAAYNIYGCESDGAFRLAGAVGIMGGQLTADLAIGPLRSRLYQLSVSAATIALQAEWRPWAYLSFVPHLTGWRLLAVEQKVGTAETSFPVSNKWHGSTGMDLWLYPIPNVDSHLSLGMLLAFGGDKPVTSFTLSWTFVFGDADEESPDDEVTEPEVSDDVGDEQASLEGEAEADVGDSPDPTL